MLVFAKTCERRIFLRDGIINGFTSFQLLIRTLLLVCDLNLHIVSAQNCGITSGKMGVVQFGNGNNTAYIATGGKTSQKKTTSGKMGVPQ